jgi:Tfp pilus assembly protein PilF
MRRFLIVAVLVMAGVAIDGIEAYAQTATAIANGAKVRIQRSKFGEANELLGREIVNYPESAELHYLYAITLARVSPQDSASKAIEHLAIADSLNGEPAEGADEEEVELQENIDQALRSLWGGIVNDGVRSLSAGDLEDAEAKLSLAVQLHPGGKEGHLGMGAVHQAKQEYDLAIESYKKALEIDPAYKNALLRLGQTYQLKAEEVAGGADAADNPEAARIAGEAAAVYENYLAENPDDVEVQIQLAGLHASLGHMDQAEPIIRAVMSSDSVDAAVFTDFGFRLANAGQYELADELLSRAVTMTDSLDVEPLGYLAFVRIQSENLEGARAILDKQLALDPSNAEAWEYLAYVKRDLGDTAGSAEAFEKAQSIPLELQQISMSQNPDRTWNVEATFMNRLEAPVSNVQVRFSLLSPTGEVLETKDATVAGQSLPAGEGERVTIEFSAPADNPRVKYEIL